MLNIEVKTSQLLFHSSQVFIFITFSFLVPKIGILLNISVILIFFKHFYSFLIQNITLRGQMLRSMVDLIINVVIIINQFSRFHLLSLFISLKNSFISFNSFFLYFNSFHLLSSFISFKKKCFLFNIFLMTKFDYKFNYIQGMLLKKI